MILKKNKKGLIFFGLWVFLGMILLIVFLSIIFYSKVEPFFEFLKIWWWAIALTIGGVLWHRQIAAVVNFILSKLGIKV